MPHCNYPLCCSNHPVCYVAASGRYFYFTEAVFMTVEISILIALIGCFVGLGGWLAGRDKKIGNDAEWRGAVNEKLDAIRADIGGVGGDIKYLRNTLIEHGERLTAVEESTKQAHKRIDELKKSGAP